MAHFEIYPSPLAHAPYLVDIQSNLLEPLTTRVVIPLKPVNTPQIRIPSRLAPVIEIRSQSFILSTAAIATDMAVEIKSPLPTA
ncbi:CcdB family protein [Hyphomicrobium sp. DY-1]|jgi:toxin CcdB|uniref:CcdB family protein n=1 Tax=Hyphomicrobium sp. DY-1 TaxID=3075650 RepID=UPI0039C08D32